MLAGLWPNFEIVHRVVRVIGACVIGGDLLARVKRTAVFGRNKINSNLDKISRCDT